MEVHCNGLVGKPLRPEVEGAVKAVVAEGLRNVAAHAEARTVSVFVRRSDGMLRVLVEDDGVGFVPVRRRGGGLEQLQALAADVGGSRLLESRRGKGTSVGLEVRA